MSTMELTLRISGQNVLVQYTFKNRLYFCTIIEKKLENDTTGKKYTQYNLCYKSSSLIVIKIWCLQ